MSDLETRIGQWFGQIADITPENIEARRDVELVITKLDDGQLRVAEIATSGVVVVHEWVRQAILLLFRVRGMERMEIGPFEYVAYEWCRERPRAGGVF
jgi:tetrahydrodipicolinate N-succinyltransferase